MNKAGLWDWAVAAYAAPGVAEACLALQDQDDQCVPLVLWAAWSTAHRHPVDAEAAADIARIWTEQAVAPLRAMRRRLKGPVSDMDDAARLAFRERVKVLELEAERHLLSALEGLEVSESQSLTAFGAMMAVSRAWGPKIPRPGLHRLYEALSAGGFLQYDKRYN